MIKKIVISAFIIVIGLIAFGLFQAGLFTGIEVKEGKMGPYELVYAEHKGPYKDIVKVQDRIYQSLLKNDKIETRLGFGIYYDDPRTVPQDKLRSIGGCILENKDSARLPELRKKYKTMSVAEKESVYAEFPMRTKFSVVMGAMRVYPKLGQYLKEKGYGWGPVMEIYDVPGKKIIYLLEKIKPSK